MTKKPVIFLPVLRNQITLPIDLCFLAFFTDRLDDGVQIVFSIGGYDSDKRELFEVPEVRDWMRALFIESKPEALRTLYAQGPGFLLVKTCCNETRKARGGVETRLSPAWIHACKIAGVSP